VSIVQTARYDYPFTQDEATAAYEEWSCNCGPAALAFALQVKLGVVRPALKGFAERGYVNPTMMASALEWLHTKFTAIRAPKNLGEECMFQGPMSLVRIQWTGPWTADGKTAKWAASYTHWICCWMPPMMRDVPSEPTDLRMVFDINGGIMPFWKWRNEIVPAIVATIKRADGGWYPANVWQLEGR